MSALLVISDMHHPYAHPGCVDFLADLARLNRPSEVVCVGDECDLHRWSTHPQNPDMPGPAEELRLARLALRSIYKLFPKVRVCNSNHMVRWAARAAEANLPSGILKDMRGILEAPAGWEWRDTWDVAGVHYRHGDGFSGKNAALSAAERIRKRVVIGHVHSGAGVQYSCGPYDTVWGMNVGALIDTKHPAFSYGKWGSSQAVLGAGLVLDGVPFFVPMP